MIVLEFIVFVVTSGLFCSEKFRGHLWAVIVAGAVATGSSLLFTYDLGARLTGHGKEPPVITKIVRQTVVKTVPVSHPAAAAKPNSCAADYPEESLRRGEEGTTVVSIRILTDGTVVPLKVALSSGSEKLDEAAMRCVANWHYRPAIKNGQIVETISRATVKWVLSGAQPNAKPEAPKPEEEPKTEAPPSKEAPQAKTQQAAEGHSWYDVGNWFAGEPEKKVQ